MKRLITYLVLGGGLLLLLILLRTAGDGLKLGGEDLPDRFGIYTARLDGGDLRTVIVHPTQQMTHPRVSPDGEWITFTRYTNTNWAGLAMEKGGYKGTEIMLARLDGSELQTLVPAQKGVLNCNSSWTDDGRALVWLSTANPERQPRLMRVDLQTREVSRVPTPPGLKTTDPDVEGDRIVFPVIEDGVDTIWIMDLDGGNARRLTRPEYDEAERPDGKHPPGDYDPKISPDGTTVAFMRLFGKNEWKIMTVDVASREQTRLSGPAQIDALPDWSSDGERLLFWHVDRRNPERMGIYSMRPDGSDRRMVPLPRGYLHGHPHFFPDSGSGPDARIIYQAIRAPKLP